MFHTTASSFLIIATCHRSLYATAIAAEAHHQIETTQVHRIDTIKGRQLLKDGSQIKANRTRKRKLVYKDRTVWNRMIPSPQNKCSERQGSWKLRCCSRRDPSCGGFVCFFSFLLLHGDGNGGVEGFLSKTSLLLGDVTVVRPRLK